MRVCEIVYVHNPDGWKWRLVSQDGDRTPRDDTPQESKETYELFYECLTAARARGLTTNRRYL